MKPNSAPNRSGLAALISSLLPGGGHLLVGRRRVGVALLVVDLLVAVALTVVWIRSPDRLLEALVTPSALVAIMVFNVAAFLYRGLATADSFFTPNQRGVVDWAAGAVAALVVLVPHLVIGNLALTQNDLILSVFADSEPLAASGTTTSIYVAEDRSTTTSAPGPATTERAATTTTATPRIWDGLERLNIMLLGSDAGVGRIGTRTDTIILVSVDPRSGDVAMFSVPRNLTEAPLPEDMGLWECHCFPDIITHLWANAEWYPDAFPGPQSPPINALKGALGLVFGVDVHYYAKVDLAGFVGIIDAVGGVTIDVPKRIVDESYPHEDGGTEHIVFEEGTQHLDGHQTLAYSRIRRHSGDFARMHRQRCVLGALVEQTSALDLLNGYGEFAAAVKEHVETDIPIDRLDYFVELLTRVSTDRMATLRITRYNYESSGHAGYQIYDLERIKEDAHALMADPTLHLETQDGVGFDATCDQSFD